MPDINTKIKRLDDAIGEISKKGLDVSISNTTKKDSKASNIYSFKEKKNSYYLNSFEGCFNELKKEIANIASECKGQDAALELLILWKDIEKSRSENRSDFKRIKDSLSRISEISSRLSIPKKIDVNGISLKAPLLPAEIKSDVAADLSEIEKCFNAGVYRSATILCGRVLETCLHRKYYEATGQDILEKNPGIGLGNLIAKLKEKNIDIDPALTQQIHLINNVRIFSVHKKQEAFVPSKNQAHAIILYTVDVLNKMWK
ncbi:MAG: DUF4145 domain-containing protein [Candidatus Woesearchaeota archaeon]|nr:DUF4145 domain-containing protein [Candidatus Woesearchaeota archaeon]